MPNDAIYINHSTRPMPARDMRDPVVTITAPWGATFDLYTNDRSLEPAFLTSGCYEPTELDILAKILQPGMHVLDIGSGFGYHAVLAAQRTRPGGAVVAVEPEPDNYRLVCHNLRRNGCAEVICLQLAVADHAGQRNLAISKTNRGRHSLIAGNVPNPRPQQHTVQISTVDDIARRHMPDGRVDLLKVDVEGAEELVLDGATQVLAQANLVVWMELWPAGLRRAGTDPVRLIERLQRLGGSFQAFLYNEHGDLAPISDETARISEGFMYLLVDKRA